MRYRRLLDQLGKWAGRVGLALTVMLVASIGQTSRATLVLGRLNANGTTRVTNNTGTPRPFRDGTFSIHAGANVGGMLTTRTMLPNGQPIIQDITGGTNDIKHVPAQAGAANTTFPVRIHRATSGNIPFFPFVVTTPLPAGVTYATQAKDVTSDLPESTDVALVTGGAAPNTTRAEAQTKAHFIGEPPDRTTYTVNTDGTYAEVRRETRLSPFGAVGNLVLDPWSFGDIAAGDVLSGSLSFDAADFLVQIDDPDGFFSAHAEFGSDFPVSTDPDPPLGNDFQGLPLVYSLDIGFAPGNLPSPAVLFQFDPAYTIFNPDTHMPLSPSSVDAFVRNRFQNSLMLNPTGDTVTLKDDLTLLEWSVLAIVGRTDVRYDMTTTQAAVAVPVPEPRTLTLFAVSLLGLCIHGRRHWWRLRSPRRAQAASGDSKK